MVKQKKYLEFEEVENPTGKTKIFEVWSNSSWDMLGEIKWYSAWRQYCFFPAMETIWSWGCLNQIVDFIQDLNNEHRKEQWRNTTKK